MSAENRVLVRRWFEEVWNQGKLQVVDEIVARDSLHHLPQWPASPGQRDNPPDIKELVRACHAAFPDFLIHIQDIIAEGDTVAVRWTASGTHNGEFKGIAPTRNPVKVPGMSVVRIADGKIAEHWFNWDALGLMEQLGIVTVQGQAKGLTAPYPFSE